MPGALLPTRRLGKTEIAVSYPGLGCGALMGAGNDTDAVKIVHRAIELGVNCTSVWCVSSTRAFM